MTILLVDEDENILEILKYWFQQQGFSTLEFKSGKEAFEYISDEKNRDSVKLIILDRMLPDMDGIELLTKLERRIPVLILSSLGADKDVLEALKKGALDYIVKPFNVDILVEKAKSIVARYV